MPTLELVGEQATALLAQDLAMVAEPGWVICLEGDVGVGKTAFARAFIRSLACDPRLDVPSPTYTLAQRYDETTPPIVHADLYRLGDPDEVIELGLDDADDPAIRLIEWPGNAGANAFLGCLTLRLEMQGEEARRVTFAGPQAIMERVRRSLMIRQFLDGSGFGLATRSLLQGDASTRRYERVNGSQPLVLMDAPRQPDGPIVADGKSYSQLAHLAESVHAFAAVNSALRMQGFAAPVLHGQDLDEGLLLLEDLGQDGLLSADGTPDPERYQAAVELLAKLHTITWPNPFPVPGGGSHTVHRFDSSIFLREVALCPDWYAPFRDKNPDQFDCSGFLQAWQEVLAPLDQGPTTLTLRDYHSPNLIWRTDQSGHQRIGLIDHQDALLGPPAYDVASLVQDARVTVPPALQSMLLDAYRRAAASNNPTFDKAAFNTAFHVMAAQRNTKVLGIFTRLNVRDGKPSYLKHLPRIEAYMRQLLSHTALAELKPFYDTLLPDAPL